MKVELHLPTAFDMDVTFDEARRVVVLTPKFIPKKARELTVVSVLVKSDADKESRGNCTVNSVTGRVSANNLDCGGVAGFDQESGEAEEIVDDAEPAKSP